MPCAGTVHSAHYEADHRIVSRGGSILAEWCQEHKQNMLYESFEDICKIAKGMT